MPETERLCVREAVTGVEETEEEEALLEPEPMPDVSREEREVDSQNWRAGRRGDAEDTVGLASPSATDGAYQRWGREARGISLTCDNGGPTQLQPPEAREPCRAARAAKGRGLPSSPRAPHLLPPAPAPGQRWDSPHTMATPALGGLDPESCHVPSSPGSRGTRG